MPSVLPNILYLRETYVVVLGKCRVVCARKGNFMTVYIVLYATILFLPFFLNLDSDKERKRRLYIILIFSMIIFVVGLRHPTMGMDLTGYLKSYGRLYDMSWQSVIELNSYLNYERGYILFNKLMGMLTLGNEQLFLFVCAMLATVPVGYTIYKKSEDILLSTLIYLGLPIFLIQYSALRQGIALGMCFYALNLIEDKKLWRFLLLIFLATLFHYTSIVFIVAYFIYHIRITDTMRTVLLLLLPIVFVFRSQLFTLLSVILKNDVIATQTNAITMTIVFVLIYIFMMVLFHGSESRKVNGYMNIFFCACLCLIFSGVYSTAIRVGYYFMIALVFILPIAIRRIRDPRHTLLLRLVIMTCFIWFSLDSIIGTYWAEAYPYFFFWQVPSL